MSSREPDDIARPEEKPHPPRTAGVFQAFGWAAVQSWAVKAVSLLLFFALARLLGKEEMGRAQSVLLLLMMIAVLAEQGLLQAIIQRRGLSGESLNAAFLVMLGSAFVLALALLLGASPTAGLMGTPEVAPLLRWASPIPLLTVLVGFMGAIYKRQLDTRRVAKAAVIGSLSSAAVALTVALNGFGALSLVVQALVMNLAQALVLWWHAPWRPRLRLDLRGFRELLGFSTAVFASRCVDYMVGRSVEFVILGRLGVAGLGIYAIASKLYLTLVELLAQTIYDVTLSTLSRLSADARKFGEAYLHLMTLASSTTMPLFVLVALLSTDLCVLLFGESWREAGGALHWLAILGAAEVMQYFNGAAIGARGRPRWILGINLAKLALVTVVLQLAPGVDADDLVRNYVLAMLCVSPASFWLASKATGVSLWRLVLRLWPGVFACAVASCLALLIAQCVTVHHVLVHMLLVTLTFTFSFALIVLALARRRLLQALRELKALRIEKSK
jgi:O-antigen/teichoic acid export membrane protein